MKIQCNLKKHFFKYLNEARGVALRKKELLRNDKAKVGTYLDYIILICFILTIIATCSLLVGTCSSFIFGMMIILLTIVFVIYCLINILSFRQFHKKHNFIGEITLSKEGLSNTSFYGIKILFSWDKIKALVIRRHTITILTDTPIYFYQSIDNKDVIIEIIKKYKKDIKIIGK